MYNLVDNLLYAPPVGEDIITESEGKYNGNIITTKYGSTFVFGRYYYVENSIMEVI